MQCDRAALVNLMLLGLENINQKLNLQLNKSSSKAIADCTCTLLLVLKSDPSSRCSSSSASCLMQAVASADLTASAQALYNHL